MYLRKARFHWATISNLIPISGSEIHHQIVGGNGKSSSYQEKTRDAVLKGIENSLRNIGIDYFDFYYMWSVKSLEQYEFIMSDGGPYEGVLSAKERGLVKHICFSSHASVQDTVKIIQEGAFEGVLVSYSLLNFYEQNRVLKAAGKSGLGVAVMNPLGGGIIPQNEEMFSGAVMEHDCGIVDAALKFVYSNEAVSTVLCGISGSYELKEDVRSLSMQDKHGKSRQLYTVNHLEKFPEFCTGCNYCGDCPSGIPIQKLMTAYNQTKFRAENFIYNRTSPELIKRGNFFRALEGKAEFEDVQNPCIKCGKCEKLCTQSLPVMKTIDEIYGWAAQCCVSVKHRRERLKKLIPERCKRVGFYTAGVYTSFIMSLYRKLVGIPHFEMYVFDSDPQKWGELYLEEMKVTSPQEIPKLGLDVLLISNYIHSDSIYEELTAKFPGENIQKLHMDGDVPWMF